jgi:uncharacterized protein YhdP
MKKPPRNVPTIDLIVNELVYRGHSLGRLEVDAHNEVIADEPIWTLDKLELANPDATLTANATWRTLPAPATASGDDSRPRRTTLGFTLDVANGGQFLDRFGLPHTVNGGAGKISGHAAWNGSPAAVDMNTLDGKVGVDLRHGQILRAPGAAKLLGIFSLRSLANLLTLHFEDVVGKGLPFARKGRADDRRGCGRHRRGGNQSAARSGRARRRSRALEVHPEGVRDGLFDHRYVDEARRPASAWRSG